MSRFEQVNNFGKTLRVSTYKNSAKIESKIAKVIAKKMVPIVSETFENLVRYTPAYSHATRQSWYLNLGRRATRAYREQKPKYNTTQDTLPPLQYGDRGHIERELRKLSRYNIKQRIYIQNVSPLIVPLENGEKVSPVSNPRTHRKGRSLQSKHWVKRELPRMRRRLRNARRSK